MNRTTPCPMNNRTYFWQTLLLTGCLLITAGRGSWAQQPLAGLQQRFGTYQAQSLQEKLFVHADRSFYLTGEIMWFRLFDVDGSIHRPLDISKVAYLELLNSEQKAVLQTKVSMDTGKGMGSLLLPTSLPSGHYVLRAYTAWMKATSPAYLFEKPITIVNPFRTLGLPLPVDSLAYDVQFFPEGGNLVSGLPAKVAFKVVDTQKGLGVDCQGALLTQTNDTVARFATLKFGMGTFSFTPLPNTTYRVALKDRRKRAISRPLPAVYASGYTMQVADPDAQQIRVIVRTNKPVSDANSAVYLIAQTRQIIKVAEVKAIRDNQATFLVDKSSLGDGITQFTVFDAATQPVCERLYFKRPPVNLLIAAKADKSQYDTRSPVSLALAATDGGGKSLAASVSVSVYRVDSLQSGEAINLPDYLWLTSDLRGTIESPEYYLTTTGAEADAATDNLMLTQGWRRFRWEKVLTDSLKTGVFPEYKGLTIQGRVTNAQTGEPAKGISTYLSVPGKVIQLRTVRSDDQGLVRYQLDKFYGTHDVVLQTATPDSTYRLAIDNPYTETPATTRFPFFDLNANLTDQITTRSLSMQVQNSYHNQYTTPTQPPRTDSAAFYGQPNEHYELDAFTRFTVMEEVLSEYVPGVLVRRRNRHFVLRVNNIPYLQVFQDDPLLLIDGVPIVDTDRLMEFSPLKIKSLDVITRRYFLGYSNLSGIISFRTYKGDLAGFQLNPRAVVVEYDGLQSRREFYTPQYASPQQLESRLPDFRSLLYWNPDVLTGLQKENNLQFYTSDQEGNYLIVVQGMTADGRSASTKQLIRVRHRPD